MLANPASDGPVGDGISISLQGYIIVAQGVNLGLDDIKNPSPNPFSSRIFDTERKGIWGCVGGAYYVGFTPHATIMSLLRSYSLHHRI